MQKFDSMLVIGIWDGHGMKSTIYDVAQRSGVSVATVSRYLNRSSQVKAETVRNIEDAIATLDYSPRKKRATHRSMMIGVIAPTLNDSFSLEILEGIRAACGLHHYKLTVQPSYWNLHKEEEQLRIFKQQKLDAVIVVIGFCPLEMVKEIMTDTPVLFVCRDKNDWYPVLWSDNVIGGRLATNHLIQLGHSHIAHITGPDSSLDSNDRLTGYRQSLEASGMKIDNRLVVRGDFSLEGGYRAMKSLLKRGVKFSAVFIANDLSAFGAMRALNEHGLQVPSDISVVGFDDHAMCDYYIPKLTTIKQPLFDIGKHAYSTVLNLMREQPAESFNSTFELVVRNSTQRIEEH